MLETLFYFIPIILLLLFIMLNQVLNLNDKFRILFKKKCSDDILYKWQGIIYPSLSIPIILLIDESKENEFSIYLSFNEKIEQSEISAALYPVDKSLSQKTLLNCIKIDKIKTKDIYLPGRPSAWVIKYTHECYKVNFKIINNFQTAKRNTLYDLEVIVKDKILRKNSSVVFETNKLKEKKILLATDIHVASRWDEIENQVNSYFQSISRTDYKEINELLSLEYSDLYSKELFFNSFINPNKNLVKFIKRANKLYDDGELDYILFTGDLVDYKFKDSKNKIVDRYDDTEWSLFEKIISGKYKDSERLKVPIFTTTGNHDYRLYPYELQIYGMRHCGIANDYNEEYLKRTNQYRSAKYKLSDLDAIRINTGKDHSLNYYYRYFNPFGDYHLNIGDTDIIFLDTKSDIFCNIHHLFSRRIGRFLSDLEHPSSVGIESHQVKFFKRILKENNNKRKILITHAPIVNTKRFYNYNSLRCEESLTDEIISLNESDNFNDKKTDAYEFENRLYNKGLAFSTVFQNQFNIISPLLMTNNSIVFSGHNHRIAEYGLSKKDGRFYMQSYSKVGNMKEHLKDKILFMQTQSLGHIQRSEFEFIEPGYRLIKISNNGINSAENMYIDAYPFEKTSVLVRFESSQQHDEIIIKSKIKEIKEEFTELLQRVIFIYGDEEDSKVNFSLSDDSARMNHTYLKDYKIHITIFLYNFAEETKIFVTGRRKKQTIKICYEDILKKNDIYKSLGIRRLNNDLVQ